MSVPAALDHVVIAGPQLDALVDWFAQRTGVVAAPGGTHPTGTANALVAFTVGGRRGRHYLELIGPDPQAAAAPTTFGIAGLAAPVVCTYSVHPDDIDAVVARATAAGHDPGPVVRLSRRTPDGALLEWRLTKGHESRRDLPFLIDWGQTAHPGFGDLPAIELVSFERVEPDPVAARVALDALGLPAGALAQIVPGETPAFRLTVRTAAGEDVLL
ncbi:VOC family protein [Microbacterium sp.]|uniref:VOC family protein n=1 Tax=Microbacterium sp. TaxID=51671 RepID=UPI0039E641DE